MMYTVDEQDRVIERSDIPGPAPGAPEPALLRKERRFVLAYYISPLERDVRVSEIAHAHGGPGEGEDVVAIIQSNSSKCVLWGWPNDEIMGSHPLAGRGLNCYTPSEVLNSSWIRRLESLNAAHPGHVPAMYSRLKHIIIPFQDSTFECLVRELSWRLVRSPMKHVLQTAAAEFAAGGW